MKPIQINLEGALRNLELRGESSPAMYFFDGDISVEDAKQCLRDSIARGITMYPQLKTCAEQMVEFKKSDHIAAADFRGDDRLSYRVFDDGSVYEEYTDSTFTADEIIAAAPHCLFNPNNEEDPLQRWLLDTVCDMVGKPRVSATAV